MKILLPITHPLLRRNWIGSQADIVLTLHGHRLIYPGLRRHYYRVRHVLRLGSLVGRSRVGSSTYRHKLTLPRSLLDRAAIAVWRRLADPEMTACRIEARLPIPREAMRIIDSMRPDLLLWPTMTHDDPADDLVKAAKSRGIPVVAAPASWDTLTTKGGFLVRPDALLVWGAASARHAERDHGFARGQIAITGPPHWDHYFEPRAAKPRTKVLIAGTSVVYWEDEEDLAGRLTEDFPGRVIYRRHPRRGGNWSWKACLELRDQLDETAIIVAAFSTVIVEAALQGVPSCVVTFGRGLPPLAEYEHMAEVMSWHGGVARCDSYERMRSVIEVALSHPPEDRPTITEMLRRSAREVADVDGLCRERIAEALTVYAKEGAWTRRP